MAGYTEVIAAFRPKNDADFPIVDLRYISNGTNAEGKPVMLAETIQQVKEIAQQGDNTAILNTQRVHGDAIENLKTKTTNITYTANTSTTNIGGKVSFAGATHETGVYDEKVKHILSLVKDASGNILEYTTIDGDKFFVGDVHAPNIDDMLGDMRSYLTVSLSKATTDLQKKLNSAVASMNAALPRVGANENAIAALQTGLGTTNTSLTGTIARVGANENAIATLQNKTAAITKNGTKTSISGIFELAGEAIEVATVGNGEFVDVVRDSSGNILEYTDTQGDKYFTGDVHAPNIDDMLGDMRSYLTVSLSKVTTDLQKKLNSAVASMNGALPRVGANENAIATLQNKTAAITKNGTKTTISDVFELAGKTVEVFALGNGEFIDVVRDSSGNILEYTDIDGTKFFTGDVHAPNIDDMLGNLQSFFTTSLNKTTDSLIRRMDTAEGNISAITLKTNQFTEMGTTEFAHVLKDARGGILEYTDVQGDKYFTGDVHAPNIDAMFTKLDAELAVAMSKTSSTLSNKVATLEVKVGRLDSLYEGFQLLTNSEYSSVLTDSLGKVISYTTLDGETYFNCDIHAPNIDDVLTKLDTEIAKATKDATSNIASRVSSLESSVGRLALVAETVSVETNSEYVDLVKDSMNKVIEYTDLDGDKHFAGNVYSPNIDEMRSDLDKLMYVYNHS